MFVACIQGGRPSPFDRNLGTKMAAKCAEKLLEQLKKFRQPDGGLFRLMTESIVYTVLIKTVIC